MTYGRTGTLTSNDLEATHILFSTSPTTSFSNPMSSHKRAAYTAALRHECDLPNRTSSQRYSRKDPCLARATMCPV